MLYGTPARPSGCFKNKMTEPQEAYSFKGVTETEMFNCGKFMFSFTGPVQERG